MVSVVHAFKVTSAIIITTVIRLSRFLHDSRAACNDGFVTETVTLGGGDGEWGGGPFCYCNVAECYFVFSLSLHFAASLPTARSIEVRS